MTLVAEFETTCEALPLVDVAAAVPDATIDIEMIPHSGGRRRFVAHVTHDDFAEVERAFEATEFVGEYRQIGEAGDSRRYKIRPGVSLEGQLGEAIADLDGLRALATTDSIIDHTRATPTGWVHFGRFADREAFDVFRRFWQDPDNGDGFKLHRLARVDEDRGGDGLSDRQREALQVAYEMGYFDIPRGSSLEEVATELGISAPACSERLRRASAHLVERHVLPEARRRDRPSERTGDAGRGGDQNWSGDRDRSDDRNPSDDQNRTDNRDHTASAPRRP